MRETRFSRILKLFFTFFGPCCGFEHYTILEEVDAGEKLGKFFEAIFSDHNVFLYLAHIMRIQA